MTTQAKRENLLYLIVWTVVFTVVPLVLLFETAGGHNDSVRWQEVPVIWAGILPFLFLFLAHNYLSAPFLVRKQYWPYIAITLALLGLFAYYSMNFGNHPPMGSGAPPPPMQDFPADAGFSGKGPRPDDIRRPLTPELMKLIIGFLIVGMNLGIKAMFRMLENEQKMQQLKAESLNQQLETLRYQINPHFFMNTLNNIHALVDVEPEKAKASIEQFSKLMRLVLYDGNAPTIPLQQETDYLKHYVSLMRLRYPESVDIQLQTPQECGDAFVPPLILASCVENAFKHGISYEQASFVHVSVSIEGDKIVFKCTNSLNPSKDSGPHGLGLENVRKRLELLYGQDYTFENEQKEGRYEITLSLPAHRPA